jgi:ABC-type sugar transport system ATPase subunit
MGAEMNFVEPQGERTILSVKLMGGEIFLVEVASDFRPKIGQTVYLRFNMERLHIFEAQTGSNILY